ncbi:hypothetical protein [Sphingomonas sp. BAUL-RG-20F-R05-02]|uniref:hypothetical protein n=1 Tax=Sphingomonas sp. BAUL-RG-20F-R05-02 TaxID=2914830 RepID=UPI001F59B2E8|nr:hypothetical protein [Sphingomonas sp. BAUL-RG-20F-R05-02]
MIVFLLLVIAAILMLGASRFIGIVGIILGTIVGIIAVTVGVAALGSVTGYDSGDVLMWICCAIIPVAVIYGIVENNKKHEEKLRLATRARELEQAKRKAALRKQGPF